MRKLRLGSLSNLPEVTQPGFKFRLLEVLNTTMSFLSFLQLKKQKTNKNKKQTNLSDSRSGHDLPKATGLVSWGGGGLDSSLQPKTGPPP